MRVDTYDEIIEDLTYDEAEDLSEKLAGVAEVDGIVERVRRAEKGATLNKPVVEPEGDAKDGEAKDGAAKDDKSVGGETWKARIQGQQTKIRGLGL